MVIVLLFHFIEYYSVYLENLNQVATGVISTINFSRSSHANLLPLTTALLYVGSPASYYFFSLWDASD